MHYHYLSIPNNIASAGDYSPLMAEIESGRINYIFFVDQPTIYWLDQKVTNT
jgi:hypothetical protein